uniref:Polysaccharide deacetylase n=1 Tax=Echinostoma caproni TaxID=27848 RepID=A0A183A144_9TREM
LDISSVPRLNRIRPEDIRKHHSRLLDQACAYAEFNGFVFNRADYEARFGVSSH